MLVLVFRKVFSWHLIGCILNAMVFVMFTDETASFLNAIFATFPLTYHGVIYLILAFIVLVLLLQSIIHKCFVKRFIYGLIFAASQTAAQLLLIAAIIYTVVPFRFVAIPMEKQMFYGFSLFITSALMSAIVTWHEYCKRSPRQLSYLETVMKRHSRKKEEVEGPYTRLEGFLWKDFEQGLVAHREETDEILKRLENERFCLLLGHQASGKSIILRSVGYQLILKGHIALIVDNVERFDVKEALLDIEHWNLPNVVVMIDDVHRNPKACSDFLNDVDKFDVKVLFSSRPLNLMALKEGEGLRLRKIYQQAIETKVSRNLIERIVTKYCISLGARVRIKKEDIDSVMEKCGTDLWLVSYFLLSWDLKERSLREVAKENIYQRVYNTRVAQWSLLGKEALELMKFISALYQYEIPVFEKYLANRDLTSVALRLAEEGHLIRKDRYYYLHHPSVARIYLEAFSFYDLVENPSDYSSEALVSYLDECKGDRSTVLYKLATLPLDRRDRQKEIIRNLVTRIDIEGILFQIDSETDVEKIGHFFRYISQIDTRFAGKVLHSVKADNLRKTFSQELSIRKQNTFIQDISLVERDYAEVLRNSKGSRVVVFCLNNEEGIVSHVLPKILSVDIFDQVLVIDDGSSDLTAKRAKDYGAKVLRSEISKGLLEGLLGGIQEAKKGNAEVIFLCPYPFAVYSNISEMIRPIVLGDVDLLVGSRPGSPQVLNRKGMDAFLKYLDDERKEQILQQGFEITSILFKKILRVREVPVSYIFPREIYAFYQRYRRHRQYDRRALLMYDDIYYHSRHLS